MILVGMHFRDEVVMSHAEKVFAHMGAPEAIGEISSMYSGYWKVDVDLYYMLRGSAIAEMISATYGMMDTDDPIPCLNENISPVLSGIQCNN